MKSYSFHKTKWFGRFRCTQQTTKKITKCTICSIKNADTAPQRLFVVCDDVLGFSFAHVIWGCSQNNTFLLLKISSSSCAWALRTVGFVLRVCVFWFVISNFFLHYSLIPCRARPECTEMWVSCVWLWTSRGFAIRTKDAEFQKRARAIRSRASRFSAFYFICQMVYVFVCKEMLITRKMDGTGETYYSFFSERKLLLTASNNSWTHPRSYTVILSSEIFGLSC